MKKFLEDEFEKLKLYFGSFHKLIEVNHPQIARHFEVKIDIPKFSLYNALNIGYTG